MKRWILVLSFVLLLSTFCSCRSQESLPISAVLSTGKVEYYYRLGIPETVEEMPEKCIFIVKGKFLDDAEGTITYLDEVADLGYRKEDRPQRAYPHHSGNYRSNSRESSSRRPNSSSRTLLCGGSIRR